MGGKTSTTTQSTQIPREVLDRYRAVNIRAEQVAQQPFMRYPGQFVAGLTPTQQAGITGTSQAANLAQPYYGAAAGYTVAGAQDVGPLTYGQIGYYMNPFTEAVAAPTYQALRQQQQQEMAGQTANAIRSGAFGGDRSGLVAANLARQQQLGTAQAMAPIYQQAYQQAVQTAAGQQGVIAQDLQRRLAAGQQLAGLGTGAQAAALQGAQAQLAAGTAEQQTQQADLTARYQQFLQERGYPFQVAQFLANIAMGTGALSGSTTTTTQPAGFFSDERLKKDAVRIGETDEGVPIYSFRYKGDDGPKQIGLMAQDVERVHPEAVGLAAAADGRYYKTVDYEKATERPRREYGGGLDLAGADENWMGGAVGPDSGGEMYARGGYVAGGLVSPQDIQAILAAQREAFGPFSQAGLYGGQGAGAGAPGGRGIVPEAKLPVPRLATPSGAGLKPPTSGFQEAARTGKEISELYKMGKAGLVGSAPTRENPQGTAGLFGAAEKFSSEDNAVKRLAEFFSGKAAGGAVDDENEIDPYELSKDPLGDVVKAGRPQIRELPKPGQPPGAPKSGLSEITDLAKAGSALYSLLALLPFSDERMKSNVAPVGETYEGQTIYKYNLGDGPTQIGLMAQESRKDAVHKDGLGLLHLDYDKATEGSKPFAYGGLVPRSRYADGGSSIDADLPAEGAMEVQRLENPLAASIRKTAEEIGVSPVDLATAISYETAGTFDPWKRGPTTKWGEHRGLIQWGEPQRAQYGVSERSTPAEQMTAVGQYLRDRGVQPGMGLRDIYSAINAGRVGRYGATDEPAGGAPGTVAQKVAGMGGHRAKAARFLGMDSEDLPVEGAQESGPVTLGEAAGRKAGEYAGVEAREAGLGDVAREYLPSGALTSEKFWLPALSFVGSMLASKSPTLGQAIGEGLIGGVSGYQSMVKQQADLAKSVLDIVKDRFVIRTDPDTGQTIYMNKMTGQPMSPLQFQEAVTRVARGLGVSPAVLGLGPTPGIAAPTAPSAPTAPGAASAKPSGEAQPALTAPGQEPTKPSERPTEAPKPAVNKFNMSLSELKDYAEANPKEFGLVGERDPVKLRREIASYEKAMKNAEMTGNEAEAARYFSLAKQSRDILNQNISDAVDRQYKDNLEIQKASTQRAEEYRKDIVKRSDQYSSARASLTRLADIYSRYEPGRPAAIKAELQQWFAAAGIPLPASFSAERYDEALKIALTQAFNIVGENNLSRAPKAALAEAIQTVPAPQLASGAAYSLIGRTVGEMDYYHTRDRDYLKEGRGVAPEDFLIDYSKKTGNKPEKFIGQAFGEIPVGKGVKSEDIDLLRKTYGDFTPKLATPSRPATGPRQEAPAVAPQIPPPDKRETGKVYMTPQGPAKWMGTGWQKVEQ